ncbi:methyltransferase domain-containing protein [Pseudonocardia sp. NPDC049635]|uniref:methyltransferase domain-containing protein n=1 Tax=Pseudonocardia sp. NPDC049635 TaxID=3155506 RepID=UPI0033F8999B
MRTADDARARLVADLEREGRVHSPRIRAALLAVPRHLFLPGSDPIAAYADEAVPIKSADGVTVSSVSQPSMVAIMLEQLDAAPGHRVLEIGAGAGWNAALLAHIVGCRGAVTTVDIDEDLVEGARANLLAAGFDEVETITADGAGGYPPSAPYDRIELTVGSTGIRPEWVLQLTPTGRLLLPLTVRGSQLSVAFARTGPHRLASVSVRSCAFVRLRGAGADPGADTVLPGSGWTVQHCGNGAPEPDPGVLERVLHENGVDRPAPVAGSVSDLWDGLGLWSALADPAVVRLLGPSRGRLADTLFPLAGGRAGLGITADDGCALLLAEPAATLRSFGPDGGAAADRLAGLAEDWIAAGRPHAADLRIDAFLGGSDDGSPAGDCLTDTAGTVLCPSWGPRPGERTAPPSPPRPPA